MIITKKLHWFWYHSGLQRVFVRGQAHNFMASESRRWLSYYSQEPTWFCNVKLNNTRYIYPLFNKYARQGEDIQPNHSQIWQSRSSCEGYNLSLGSVYFPPSVDQWVKCCLDLAFSLGRVSYMQLLQENDAHCKQWIDIHYETLCQS